jgi:DNA processing protein
LQKKEVNILNDFTRKLVLLDHWQGVGWTTIQTILQKDPHLTTLQNFTVSELAHLNKNPSPQLQDLPVSVIDTLLVNYQRDRIHILSIFDERYPELLRESYQPPWVLYAKGDLTLLATHKKLAVVGSRQATTYGKMSIKTLFPKLIEQQFVIVSGLAKGIDAIGHETAIALGGRTIGVIAGGFSHIYPLENKGLANKMMETQLVLSEYPPHSKPQRWQFPLRNRIISGLTLGTLIIEAKRKSGSLITGSLALNEGREVFAVPGNIASPYSFGTNDLIKQGAKLVQSTDDILEELNY